MPLAMKQLAAISDKRIQEAITKVLDSLEIEPDKRGKQLTENLSGLWSVRAYRQRYRIIYKLNTEQKEVVVVALGIRREGDRADIYALAKRLIRAGLLTLLTLLIFIPVLCTCSLKQTDHHKRFHDGLSLIIAIYMARTLSFKLPHHLCKPRFTKLPATIHKQIGFAGG